MPEQHEYVFMTLQTLKDLRRKGEVESLRDRYFRAEAEGERPPFDYYEGKRVVSVPDGMIERGAMLDKPTPEIVEWLRERWADAPFVEEIAKAA